MKSPTLGLCFWSLLWCADAPLLKKSSAPHLWNTYIPHATHPEGSIIPRSVSVASTLLSVSVSWLQGLSIYSFKSSGHLLDLWWWRLWPWDAWAVPIEIPFPVGKEGGKKALFLSGSRQCTAMLRLPRGCSTPFFKWLLLEALCIVTSRNTPPQKGTALLLSSYTGKGKGRLHCDLTAEWHCLRKAGINR